MFSKNKDWFRYNRYWRVWERVLLRGGGDFTHQVAVQLTPINDEPGEWNETREVRISRNDVRYAVKPAKHDITWTHNLPDEVYITMVEKLGKEKADFLVHADIYKLVDWNKFTQNSENDKLNLDLCRRDLSVNFRSIVIDVNGSREIYLNRVQFALYADVSLAPNCDLVGGVVVNKDNVVNNQVIIYYDHVNDITAIEIKTCIPEKEEILTRIVGRPGELWNERVLKHINEMVALGHFSENNVGVVREVTDNAWAMVQEGNI